MAKQTVELFQRHGASVQRWSWRRRAANGKVILTAGEGYFSKWNAKRAALRANPDITAKELKVDSNA